MESVNYLLIDENGKEHSIFSGDTLFLGDVGRPDLAVKTDLTQEQLAEHLYDSLRNKLMTLPKDVIVYPGHGAGSACGKNMRSETVGTIGEELETNYALRADMTKEEFVKEVTDGLLPPPSYFPKNAVMNKEGYESFDTIMDRGMQELSPDAFEAAANETSALILDTRDPETFAKGFIPNSINIGVKGSFAPWVGALIPDIKQQILLVSEPGTEEEVITRLARVGYDNAIGYLKGGMDAWKESGRETDSIRSISPEEYKEIRAKEKTLLIDVRKPGEYQAEHIEDVKHIALDYMNDHMSEFTHDETQYIHCAGGYRSMIASSILKARGFDNVVNIQKGFKGMKAAGLPTTDYVCPTTLK
jgi:rhodanese-related sulfurtransferase